MILTVSTLLAFAQPVPAADCATLRFSVAPALAGGSQEVGICREGHGHPGEMLFRRTATPRGGQPVVSYASTRTCPAARRQLQALEELELPRPDVPDFGREFSVITLDGAGYVLQGQALYGQYNGAMQISSNVGTPLARWIDATLAVLAPCWRDRPSD